MVKRHDLTALVLIAFTAASAMAQGPGPGPGPGPGDITTSDKFGDVQLHIE